MVGGTIPESAGLSSSSAMVVASALTFLAANAATVDRSFLADLLAHAERYVGSEGGGMDQAVSLLAESGHALRIDFFPLRTQPVPLRKEITFVVCNSLVRAPKSESARYAYNRRVVECRLATTLLSHAIRTETGRTINPERMADLSSENVGLGANELQAIARRAIGEQPLSLAGAAERLGTTPSELETRCCTLRDGSVLKEPPDGFQIWKRYRHVVSEAARVGLMANALRDGDIGLIGELMNQSHASCRDDYELSCPELEVLVALGREHGALGARLTGAGFGGCTVHAVPSERVGKFMAAINATYYDGFVRQHSGGGFAAYGTIHDVMFPCRAARGAGVISIGEADL
jgi:N-acetylgalactosamine kinase